MTGTIYIIKNSINTRIYIGQTINTLDYRLYQHKYDAKHGSKTKFHVMKNLGIDNFYIEPIKDNISINELDEEENYYIHYYNSIENGYNSTLNSRQVYYKNERTIDSNITSILLDYINGMSTIDLAIKYNYSITYINRFIPKKFNKIHNENLFKNIKNTCISIIK